MRQVIEEGDRHRGESRALAPEKEGDGQSMSDQSEEELPRVWPGESRELVERVNAGPYTRSFTFQIKPTACA